MGRDGFRVAVWIPAETGHPRQMRRGIGRFGRRVGGWRLGSSYHWSGREADRRQAGEVDGIITGAGGLEELASPRWRDVPHVVVSSARIGDVGPQVIPDDRAIGRLAAEHLIDLGLRHVAYVGAAPAHHDANRRRSEGVAAAAADTAGHVRFVGQTPDDLATLTDIPRLAQWLAALPRPVGVVAFSDLNAESAVFAAETAGLDVPDDVAVVGVDNDDVVCEIVAPPLTSVDTASETIGYRAAELLDALMRGQPAPAEPSFVPPRGIVRRASTDLTTVDPPVLRQALRFIHDRTGDGITVDDVAEHVLVSRTTLEQLFRRHLDRSPYEQIVRRRIEMVRELLSTTNLPLVDIAVRCGYRHISHLSSAFRRATGLTPSQYRKQVNR